jgi:hypothetical protein
LADVEKKTSVVRLHFTSKARLFGLKSLLSGRYAQQDLASLLKKIGKNAVFWYEIPTGKGAEPQTTLIMA